MRSARGGHGGQLHQDAVAKLRRHGCIHAAGHRPGGVNALLRQSFDDLQAELAQFDAQARQLGILLDHADHVALGGIGVHAEQQVGRGEIEEAEGVRLHVLRAVQQLAQLARHGRDAHRQNGVAGLGRRQQVADRADAANAGGDAGHLVERPPLGELLESAHLGDVELRAGDMAIVVQMDRDLCVSFDPAYRIDHDSLHCTLLIQTSPWDWPRACGPPAGR